MDGCRLRSTSLPTSATGVTGFADGAVLFAADHVFRSRPLDDEDNPRRWLMIDTDYAGRLLELFVMIFDSGLRVDHPSMRRRTVRSISTNGGARERGVPATECGGGAVFAVSNSERVTSSGGSRPRISRRRPSMPPTCSLPGRGVADGLSVAKRRQEHALCAYLHLQAPCI